MLGAAKKAKANKCKIKQLEEEKEGKIVPLRDALAGSSKGRSSSPISSAILVYQDPSKAKPMELASARVLDLKQLACCRLESFQRHCCGNELRVLIAQTSGNHTTDTDRHRHTHTYTHHAQRTALHAATGVQGP